MDILDLIETLIQFFLISTKYKKNGINAASSLTMTWIDGPGADNKIINLTGYYTVAEGEFDYGELYWGSNYVVPGLAPHKKDVKESFNEDINYTSDNKTAGTVRADSFGYIVSPKDKKIYKMTLKVSPTIFD